MVKSPHRDQKSRVQSPGGQELTSREPGPQCAQMRNGITIHKQNNVRKSPEMCAVKENEACRLATFYCEKYDRDSVYVHTGSLSYLSTLCVIDSNTPRLHCFMLIYRGGMDLRCLSHALYLMLPRNQYKCFRKGQMSSESPPHQ